MHVYLYPWSKDIPWQITVASLFAVSGCSVPSADVSRLGALNMTGTASGPILTAPAPGSTLPGEDVIFRWSANGDDVLEWDLNVETPSFSFKTRWTTDQSRPSVLVRGIPTDGSRVAVRLWFLKSNGWHYKNFWYTAARQTRGSNGLDPSSPPNVVLIVADDLGYGEMSTYRGTSKPPSQNKCGSTGQRFIRTPNMDALAQRGARFTNAYTTASICNASRTGIQTGRYQQDFGVFWYSRGQTVPGEPTLGRFMKAEGYTTGYIGKVHDAGGVRGNPMDYGFDEFFGFFHHSHDYFKLRSSDSPSNEKIVRPLVRNREGEVGRSGYITRVFADEASEFITKHRNRPFFLQIAFNAVHTPIYQAPAPYKARYGITPSLDYPEWDPNDGDYETHSRAWHENRKTDTHARQRLLSILEYLDDSVGDIIESLRASGLYDNTLIIFTADNGGGAFNCANNGPLSGFKFSLDEGGIRVPYLISWPDGGIAKNQVVDTPVSTLDIFPTLVAAAKGQRPSGRDGENLLPLLRGQEHQLSQRPLFWHQKAGGYFNGCGEEWAVREGNWKLLQNCEGIHLYNLRSDPGEQNNLAADLTRVARMQETFDRWSQNL